MATMRQLPPLLPSHQQETSLELETVMLHNETLVQIAYRKISWKLQKLMILKLPLSFRSANHKTVRWSRRRADGRPAEVSRRQRVAIHRGRWSVTYPQDNNLLLHIENSGYVEGIKDVCTVCPRLQRADSFVDLLSLIARLLAVNGRNSQ
jgi:hypothetical protein